MSASRKLTGSTLRSATIQRSISVKCHGSVLDFRLTRKEHMNINKKKAHNVLCVCGRDNDTTWDLKPKVVCWLPFSIIRSSTTIAPLVCGPDIRQLVSRND